MLTLLHMMICSILTPWAEKSPKTWFVPQKTNARRLETCFWRPKTTLPFLNTIYMIICSILTFPERRKVRNLVCTIMVEHGMSASPGGGGLLHYVDQVMTRQQVHSVNNCRKKKNAAVRVSLRGVWSIWEWPLAISPAGSTQGGMWPNHRGEDGHCEQSQPSLTLL